MSVHDRFTLKSLLLAAALCASAGIATAQTPCGGDSTSADTVRCVASAELSVVKALAPPAPAEACGIALHRTAHHARQRRDGARVQPHKADAVGRVRADRHARAGFGSQGASDLPRRIVRSAARDRGWRPWRHSRNRVLHQEQPGGRAREDGDDDVGRPCGHTTSRCSSMARRRSNG